MFSESAARQIQEHALDLLWSLWAELGVSGWPRRRHREWAIDPESLLLFTAWLGDADPRLRDESTDWCIRSGRYVSGTRLRNLLRTWPADLSSRWGEYAATVNAHAGTVWPGATAPRPYRPTGRSVVSTFRSPPLLSLQLRALFGVGARAEILYAFASAPADGLGALDIAELVGYTKRNVEKELDSLRLAGMVDAVRRRNQFRFRLVWADDLWRLVGELPTYFPRWPALFLVLHAVIQLVRRATDMPEVVRDVEAHAILRSIDGVLFASNLDAPWLPRAGEGAYAAFEVWTASLVQALAQGHAAVLGESRGVHRPGRLR